MKEPSLIMTADEVRATLAGRKTQFRRPVKPKTPQTMGGRPYCGDDGDPTFWWWISGDVAQEPIGRCPFGQPGDLLTVKETWAASMFYGKHLRVPADCDPDELVRGRIFYRADGDRWSASEEHRSIPARQVTGTAAWRSAATMPKWASRLTLEVIAVRVERLQDVSEADAYAEGVEEHEKRLRQKGICACDGLGRPFACSFIQQWDSTPHGKRNPWASNPWVWVVGFEVVK